MFEDGFPSWIIPAVLFCVMGVAVAVFKWLSDTAEGNRPLAELGRVRSCGQVTTVTVRPDAVIVHIEFGGRFISAEREVKAWHDIVDQVYNGENCKTAAGFAVLWDAVVQSNKEHRELYQKRSQECLALENLIERCERETLAESQKADARKRAIEKLVAKIRADRSETKTLGKDLVALQNLIAGLAERCHGQSELLAKRAEKSPIGPHDFTLPPQKWTPAMVKAFNEMPPNPKQ